MNLDEWEPTEYCENEIANAIMNVAAEIRRLANATDGLLYGLKYGKSEGMSIAESIVVAGKNVAEALRHQCDEDD